MKMRTPVRKMVDEATPVRKMVDEAREGNKNASQIVALHDFLEVWIPRGGFDFSDDKYLQHK